MTKLLLVLVGLAAAAVLVAIATEDFGWIAPSVGAILVLSFPLAWFMRPKTPP